MVGLGGSVYLYYTTSPIAPLSPTPYFSIVIPSTYYTLTLPHVFEFPYSLTLIVVSDVAYIFTVAFIKNLFGHFHHMWALCEHHVGTM